MGTIPLMVFGTMVLKSRVFGPAGSVCCKHHESSMRFLHIEQDGRGHVEQPPQATPSLRLGLQIALSTSCSGIACMLGALWSRVQAAVNLFSCLVRRTGRCDARCASVLIDHRLGRGRPVCYKWKWVVIKGISTQIQGTYPS